MQNITKIKNQLPHGAQTEIAKRANVTVVLVNRILAGKTENIDVMNVIADYLTELKERRQQTENRLASLID